MRMVESKSMPSQPLIRNAQSLFCIASLVLMPSALLMCIDI